MGVEEKEEEESSLVTAGGWAAVQTLDGIEWRVYGWVRDVVVKLSVGCVD